MGLHNILRAEVTCPHCGLTGPVDAEFRFGPLDLTTYALGDTLPWPDAGPRHPHRPPPGGDFEGEGYAECVSCGRDFWLDLTVRAGVLSAAEVNSFRPGHIR